MAAMRRDFELPFEDQEYLNNEGFLWETLIEQRNNWLIIRNHQVPEGYNVKNVDVAISIPAGYPREGLDMAYFYPPLSRIDLVAIPQTQQPMVIEGKTFQRWSRHRDSVKWRPGVDSLVTHLMEVEFWLENEFIKRPRKDEAA